MPRERAADIDADGRTAEARERILDAAQALFAARGFDATPTKDVSQRAGVPNGLIFYYFPTKDALLTSLIEERLTRGAIRATLDTMIAAMPEADPQASLTAMGIQFLGMLTERGELVRILLREVGLHRTVSSRFRELREENIHLLAAYLEDQVRAGRLRAAPTEALARLFTSDIVLASVLDPPANPASFVAEAVTALLRGYIATEDEASATGRSRGYMTGPGDQRP